MALDIAIALWPYDWDDLIYSKEPPMDGGMIGLLGFIIKRLDHDRMLVRI
jgi:hypothetical protein